jgi:hypothetical protein
MADNKWTQPTNPPAPLFVGQKEKDLVKQVNDELIERVIGQQVLYYAIDLERTNYHDLYGESLKKTFLSPVRVYALVEWEEFTSTYSQNIGIDQNASIVVHFHKRRLTEDQNLFVRQGDFVLYNDVFYEIMTLAEPTQLFGQPDTMVEISAKCVRAREGLFDAT